MQTFYAYYILLNFSQCNKYFIKILHSIIFSENCDFLRQCGKVRRLEQETDDNTKKRVRFACWITEAGDTHSEYVIFLFHGKCGHVNAPQYFVIRLMSAWLISVMSCCLANRFQLLVAKFYIHFRAYNRE
jgi:hypothetical protein